GESDRGSEASPAIVTIAGPTQSETAGGAHVTAIDRDFRRPVFFGGFFLSPARNGTTAASTRDIAIVEEQESSHVYPVGFAHCLPAARTTLIMSDDEFYEYEDIFWIEEPEPTLAVSFVLSPAILLFA